MTEETGGGERLPIYRVRARNTSADSANRIHDDGVARQYGFRGGLVPGVTVYGYMTVPVVREFSRAWLESGSMQIRFHEPFYEGEEVVVRCEVDRSAGHPKIAVKAEREDGRVCATGQATLGGASLLREARIEDYPAASLPPDGERQAASRSTLVAGATLGTLVEKIDLSDTSLLEKMCERLPIYYGPGAVAHPALLLGLANHALMRNFELGPWIHAASELVNRSVAEHGEEISARGRILDVFERKGHEFVVLDLLMIAGRDRIVQQVRHTAIYRPRQAL
jgi:acyl dehydratase